MGTVAIETVRAAPAQEKAKRQRLGQEFANVKYQRQLSSTRSSTRYVYPTPSERRESDSECCNSLKKNVFFFKRVFAICTKYEHSLYFEPDSRFQTFYTANITFKI